MVKIAILGATGYTALELLKLLRRHPEAEVVASTEEEKGVGGSIWLDALTSVLKHVPVMNAIMKPIDHRLLPIVGGNLVPSVQNLAIGGTSVIIVVGVALETVKALEAQMLMRHYKGFLD